MKYYKEWASKEYSLPRRLILTLCLAPVFLLLIPVIVLYFLPRLDSILHFPSLNFGFANLVIGCLFILVGGFYGMWSIGSQLFLAKGTPLPVMATQKLLVTGPFKQCRNPMVFGTILIYLGMSILIGSISSILCVTFFSVLLLIYVKLIEEKELEARFGEEYRVYKASTPFLIPRIFS
jgi:protein-S-isoprenylcysteine O-methyltransferase Ste14